MKKTAVAALILLGSMLIPMAASAAQIRAFIADFTVSPADQTDLKTTLKRLFATRLSGDGIGTVDSAAEADIVVSGSYTLLGKMFSLDAVAKTAAGAPLATAFEEGDTPDSLIPAVGKISARLKSDIVKKYGQGASSARVPESKGSPTQVARGEAGPVWTSGRIAGAQSALSLVGPKEFLIAEANALRLYRQGEQLTVIAEAALPARQKLLALDTVAADQQGKVLAFVTVMDGEAPASRIYAVLNGELKLLAGDLPYLFRSVAPNGGAKRLHAQQMGPTEDYYGDVFEASYQDGGIKLKNPIKMPRYANIFNFNTFRDQSGKSYLTAFSESGYLIVYSDAGEELWRSNEKFGGSETFFLRRDSENERAMGTPFRTRFIDQRISVTERGDVMVPQNVGSFNMGNSRSYSKSSIVSFSWNGSFLEERWRTKQSQNYLADYHYDSRSAELVLLEVVQKEGIFGKGGSVLRTIRAE